PTPLYVTVLFVASIVVAYVFSTVVNAMREVLEGKYLLPAPIARALRSMHQDRLAAIDDGLERARTLRQELDQRTAGWEQALRLAAAAGSANRPFATKYVPDTVSVVLEDLVRRRRAGGAIKPDELGTLVEDLRRALTANDVRADPALARHYQQTLSVVDYASKNAAADELRLYTIRQTEFGLLIAEPTRLGNVAAALESYTVSRYGLDLNVLWSRLQPILQRDNKDAFGAIGDAKTQLDFLVTCCWMSALTTLAWFVVLAFAGDAPVAFLAVALIGPAVAVLFYSLAVANYLSYGEIVRAAVDLNRFGLLKELHVELPDGIRQERATWAALRQLSSFGAPGIEMSYEHPPK
ncbi:MAG TPA: hypothetical protein VHT53_03660, partial [Candidatus Elarobacter sp.]|nr:hypothetical protein [Candidatus Elarobacter sp.]